MVNNNNIYQQNICPGSSPDLQPGAGEDQPGARVAQALPGPDRVHGQDDVLLVRGPGGRQHGRRSPRPHLAHQNLHRHCDALRDTDQRVEDGHED